MIGKVLFLIFMIGCLVQPATLAAQENATDSRIKSLQAKIKRYPSDYLGYAALGAAYVQKGRETGDAADYELAKDALQKSLDFLTNDPAAAFAMTQMAVICMAEHRFDDALTWAQNALAQGSGDPSPWAIAGDALADMGDYKGAAEAYARLQVANGSEDERLAFSYQRESRVSFLRFVAGDTQGAIQLMRSALRTAIETHMPAENISWSQYQLGELHLQAGQVLDAEKAYEAALKEYPGYYRALAGLAKVRSAEGRYAEAADLYKREIAAVPYPEYVAALGDVYQKLGQSQKAKQQYQLVEFIAALSRINQQIHNRDLAVFYADHGIKPAQSLALARNELEVRQDVYTWDVLAWCLYQNGKFRDASESVSHALAQGTQDALIFFHAGMIYQKLGEFRRAAEFLQRALNTNPHFHIVYAEVASQVLAQIRTKPAAIAEGVSANAH